MKFREPCQIYVEKKKQKNGVNNIHGHENHNKYLPASYGFAFFTHLYVRPSLIAVREKPSSRETKKQAERKRNDERAEEGEGGIKEKEKVREEEVRRGRKYWKASQIMAT